MTVLIVVCVVLLRDIFRPRMDPVDYLQWDRTQERLGSLALLLAIIEGVFWVVVGAIATFPEVLQ